MVEEVRAEIRDERVRTGLDQLLEYAVDGAQLSWIQKAENINTVLAAAIGAGRKPNSMLRSLYRAIADLLELKLGKTKKTMILLDVRAPYQNDGRNVAVSREQISTMVRTCVERNFPLPVVAMLLGIDRKPLLTLVRAHWDAETRRLTVPDENFRVLPVASPADAILNPAAEGKRPEEGLFPLNESAVRHGWDVIRRESGIPDVRFKDLRHRFAESFLAGGAGLRELQAVMGHSGAKTTMRYLNKVVRTDHARMEAAVAVTGLTLEDLVLPERPDEVGGRGP